MTRRLQRLICRIRRDHLWMICDHPTHEPTRHRFICARCRRTE